MGKWCIYRTGSPCQLFRIHFSHFDVFPCFLFDNFALVVRVYLFLHLFLQVCLGIESVIMEVAVVAVGAGKGVTGE